MSQLKDLRVHLAVGVKQRKELPVVTVSPQLAQCVLFLGLPLFFCKSIIEQILFCQ